MAFPHLLCPTSPRPIQAGVGSPSRHKPQDWLLKLYSLQNLLSETRFCSGVGGGLDLQNDSDVSPSPGKTNQTSSSPAKGCRMKAKARPWRGLGPLSAHPRWKDLGHSNGESKFGAPATPRPAGGRRSSQGLFGGWGSKQPPLHLAAGSWDRGQEGPICHLQSCQLLGAGWARVGDGRTAVWPRSSQAKMGTRGHFRRVGSWGGVFWFLLVFDFFSTS